jgi:hypothetical protein
LGFTKASLRLVYRWMRQRPSMIGNGAKIADINPAATLGAPDVIVSSFLWGTAQTARYFPRRICLIGTPL